jgi:hypothetical protein
MRWMPAGLATLNRAWRQFSGNEAAADRQRHGLGCCGHRSPELCPRFLVTACGTAEARLQGDEHRRPVTTTADRAQMPARAVGVGLPEVRGDLRRTPLLLELVLHHLAQLRLPRQHRAPGPPQSFASVGMGQVAVIDAAVTRPQTATPLPADRRGRPAQPGGRSPEPRVEGSLRRSCRPGVQPRRRRRAHTSMSGTVTTMATARTPTRVGFHAGLTQSSVGSSWVSAQTMAAASSSP